MLLCTLTVIVALIMRSSFAFTGTRSDEHLNIYSAKLSLWLISFCKRGCEPVENASKKAKVNKVISFDECIQQCVEEKTSGSQLGHGKSRRSLKGTEVDECTNYNDDLNLDSEPIKVKGLKADFKSRKPDVYLSWEPLEFNSTGLNWTAYALIHGTMTKNKPVCKVIPKNQTDYVVSRKHWKYPKLFYVAVVAYPYHRYSQITLLEFDPQGPPPPFSPDIPTKDTPKIVGSLVIGMVSGIILLVVMFVGVMWRRIKRCPSRYAGRGEIVPPSPLQPGNSKDIYYSCYYPENEAYREKVASIVNYFRQSGYDVVMDVMVSREISSQGPTRWAERQIRKAKKVLIFLSPRLVNLAFDEREGAYSQDANRVWVELEVLRDLYTRNRSAAKMVCITLAEFPVNTQDLPLWAKISYKWPEDAQGILKRLNDRPSMLAI